MLYQLAPTSPKAAQTPARPHNDWTRPAAAAALAPKPSAHGERGAHGAHAGQAANAPVLPSKGDKAEAFWAMPQPGRAARAQRWVEADAKR